MIREILKELRVVVSHLEKSGYFDENGETAPRSPPVAVTIDPKPNKGPLVAAGANQVSGPSFQMVNPDAAQEEARRRNPYLMVVKKRRDGDGGESAESYDAKQRKQHPDDGEHLLDVTL